MLFKTLLKVFNIKPDIALLYNPQDIFLLDVLEQMNVKVVYDCVDEHSAFPGISDASKILEAERKLLVRSSGVITVSKRLYEKCSKINPNCVYIPNGVDFEYFKKATTSRRKVQELENLKHPIIGFVGAIWDWIDVDLICELAKSHADYSILLVGPMYFGSDKLNKYSNIFAVGHKEYASLPWYLSCMDVCLIPFKINELTLASNPIKLYEYLAAGKPVVSTALPEVCNIPSELVYIGKEDEDFIRKVEDAVNETKKPQNEAIVAQRVNFAKSNSWERRIDAVEKLLRNI
jgi:glycosyltransferase involved in cell wall biosynthesis